MVSRGTQGEARKLRTSIVGDKKDLGKFRCRFSRSWILYFCHRGPTSEVFLFPGGTLQAFESLSFATRDKRQKFGASRARRRKVAFSLKVSRVFPFAGRRPRSPGVRLENRTIGSFLQGLRLRRGSQRYVLIVLCLHLGRIRGQELS